MQSIDGEPGTGCVEIEQCAVGTEVDLVLRSGIAELRCALLEGVAEDAAGVSGFMSGTLKLSNDRRQLRVVGQSAPQQQTLVAKR